MFMYITNIIIYSKFQQILVDSLINIYYNNIIFILNKFFLYTYNGNEYILSNVKDLAFDIVFHENISYSFHLKTRNKINY